MDDDWPDVVVIGAGAAGLTAAGGCGLYGLRTVLVERGKMGGECLNTGCVPSKALLAAAKAVHGARRAARFGVRAGPPDFAAVQAHVRGAIARIAPHDSIEAMAGYGVTTVEGEARFLSPHRVAVGARVLKAPRIVIATGSRPAMPAIPGLREAAPLTNETIWSLDSLPAHLVILGAGAVGVEMAQAFRRLGASVTLIDTGAPLASADADAAAVVLDTLRAEGVIIRPHAAVTRVEPGPVLHLDNGETISGSHLLVAAGRIVDVATLDLDRAGVTAGPDGIIVDRRGRTAARHIFAIGDCRAGPRLTHLAAHEGTIVVQNIALGLPARAERRRVPQVIYTEPELAQLGATEAEAREAGGAVTTQCALFANDDRSVAEDETAGFVKLVRRRRRVAGVTIVGAGAGELLLPWAQVMAGTASRWALSGAIVAYPTRSERSKAAAFDSLRTAMFHPALRRWARLLARLRRAP